MKDLKHLIFFENLLQDAQNELVTQAVNDGKIALGYNCYYIPEVLLNLPGCFSSRLRAPRCESTDVATYYMTSRVCPYVRSILERAIEGGYNYLNALFGAECCASMERMEEHFFLINPVKNDRFFVTQIDPPLKGDKTSYDYYKGQLQLKVVDQLAERYGVDTSDAAMRATIEKFNELCDVITEIGNFRKLPNPPITGYEFHVIQLVSEVCPHDLILPYLKETLAEIRAGVPVPRARRGRRLRDRRSRVHEAPRDLRRDGRGRPLLLRQLPEPRAHRDPGRRDRVRRHRPPLPALEPVRPLHGGCEDRPAPC